MITGARSLHGGQSPWWLEVKPVDRAPYAVVLRLPSDRISAGQIATNRAALLVAETHGLPAPRLLAADLGGHDAGAPATVETVIAGTSTWPRTPVPELLGAAGAVIAQIHRIASAPMPSLPYRPRPIAVDDFAGERHRGRLPTTELLQRADERVQATAVPTGPLVLVHGDVWPGNTVIAGSEVRALIDWKTAGVGNPGVDLGELRKQVFIAYGTEAPRFVTEGWERAIGGPAAEVAYWDAIAALNTPTTLYSPEATKRRDEFLSAAVSLL